MTPSAHELLIISLQSGGYHGLFNLRANCACEIDDLMPCGMEPCGCHAGWRHPDADQSEDILIWDHPPIDPVAAGQQSLFGSDEEESE